MPDEALARVPFAKAEDVCRRFELSDRGRQLLQPDLAPRTFLERLAAQKEYVDALGFLAYALPGREGVWWGALVLWRLCGPDWEEADRAALKAAVDWVVTPGEATRQAAQVQGEKANWRHPARWLAHAASLGLETSASAGPPVLASNDLAQTISGCVQLALANAAAVVQSTAPRQCLALGLAVAEGKCRCPRVPTARAVSAR